MMNKGKYIYIKRASLCVEVKASAYQLQCKFTLNLINKTFKKKKEEYLLCSSLYSLYSFIHIRV